MYDEIFISYTQPNKNIAFAIHDLLQKNGLHSWIDKSKNSGIISGQYFGGQIVKAIKNCKLFVLVHSEHTNRSAEVLKEVNNAADRRIPIHVFKLDGSSYSDNLAYHLTNVTHIDARGDKQLAMHILLSELKIGLGQFKKKQSISADKILLNNGLKLLRQKMYKDAEVVLSQYNSIDYDDMEAKFYLALAIAAGKKPRKLDGLVVKKIESLIMPCIMQKHCGYINVLLAFIKYGYYTLNGFIEPHPGTDELLQNVNLDEKKVKEILFHFHDPDNEVWRFLYESINS